MSAAEKPLRIRGIAAVVALLASACAAPLTGPAQGGAAWTELTSKHFVVRTDIPVEKARASLREFEQIQALLEDVAFPSEKARPDAAKTEVVIFARRQDYEVVSPRHTSGFFDAHPANDLEPTPRMVVDGALNTATRVTFQHELAHRYVHESLGYPAPWLNEGLAQYFSTMHVEGGRVVLGDPDPSHYFTRHLVPLYDLNDGTPRILVPVSELPSVASLVGADAGAFYMGHRDEHTFRAQVTRNYAASWNLVDTFMHGSPVLHERFDRYLRALHEGIPPGRAWAQAFDGWSLEALDQAYRENAASETIARRDVPFKPRSTAGGEADRVMTDADVHVLFARLRSWKAPADGVEEDLALAARSAPRSPDLLLTRGLFRATQGRRDEAEVDLAAAVAARPDHAPSLAALYRHRLDRARLDHRPFVDRAALLDRLEAVTRSADSLALVAHERLRTSDLDRAEAAARRAVAADLTCIGCLDMLAVVELRRDHPDRAAVLIARALGLAPSDADRERLRARLASVALVEAAGREHKPRGLAPQQSSTSAR